MTAGAAVISGFAQMCNANRVQQYRDSFVAKMQAEEGVTETGVQEILARFATIDKRLAKQFADPGARAEQCALQSRAERQAAIDRGIAGDFTGQI